MNILSSEDMLKTEDYLLHVTSVEGFELQLPNERDFQNINHFTGSLFPSASQSTQKVVHKMVTLTDNMRGLKLSNPNSVLEMFTFTIMSILYQDSCRSGSNNEAENSSFLAETLKCSLFSPNLDLSAIKNASFQINILQMKSLVSKFFNFMEGKSIRLTVNRLKCAEWILQKNPILFQTFLLFFRYVLFKLDIEGSNNYKSQINNQQSLVNLLEYLDLSYRSFGQLILFYEEGLFMAFTQKEVVAGHYFQNQMDKKSKHQQLEIKSSVKLNMIESFLMNVDEKNSLISPKNGIGESDMKLMNFMLDNSVQESMYEQSETEDAIFIKEKEASLETPTFANHPDQFHFGRRKSNRTPEDIKHQFAKLILDNSDYNEDIELQNSEAMSTPCLGGTDDYSLTNRFALQPNPTLDSPIDELSNVEHVPIQTSDQKTGDYSSSIKHVETPKTPGGTILSISLGANEQNFLLPISNKNDDLKKITSCSCRPLRINRNSIDSSVVTVGYIPEESKRTVGYPPFIAKQNYKRSYEPFKQSKNHKPAFLKTLKKHQDSTEQIDFTKSTVTEKRKGSYNRVETNIEESFKKTSAILPINQHKESPISTVKQFDVKSSKSLNIVTNNNYIDRFQGRIKNPERLTHSPSNPLAFDQRKPERQNRQPYKSGHIENHGSTYHKTNPYKFYAPVQIIAPTVYYGSEGQNSNNFVFKVNEYPNQCHFNNLESRHRNRGGIKQEVDPSYYSSSRNPKAAVKTFLI